MYNRSREPLFSTSLNRINLIVLRFRRYNLNLEFPRMDLFSGIPQTDCVPSSSPLIPLKPELAGWLALVMPLNHWLLITQTRRRIEGRWKVPGSPYTRCDYRVIHLLSGTPEGNYGTGVAVHFIIINYVVPLGFYPCTHHQLKTGCDGDRWRAAEEHSGIESFIQTHFLSVSPLELIYSYINTQWAEYSLH